MYGNFNKLPFCEVFARACGSLGVGFAVGVGVAVCVGVAVAVGVEVGRGVAVEVGVEVGVGCAAAKAGLMNRAADNKNPEMTCLLISRFPLYLWE
jgi:hypothetical protein